MTVVFKGGTSGDDHNYLPNVPKSGAEQPIQRTQNNEGVPGTINLVSEKVYTPSHNPDVPTYCSPGMGTDITDPGSMGSSSTPADIFKGSKSNG